MRRYTNVFAMIAAACVAAPAWAVPYGFTYGGRLANSSDVAVAGPVNLELKFYRVAAGGSPLPVSPIAFSNVPLEDGVFQVDLTQLSPAELNLVLDASQDTYIEVADRTNNVTYPRQHLSAMPYAMKVPVDGKTLVFADDGSLTLNTAGQPSTNQFLTKDGNGALVWATPATPVGNSLAAGTYSRATLTVDDHGRLTSAVSNPKVTLTTDVAGILPVAAGGSGTGSLTAGGVLYGNGNGPLLATQGGTPYQVLQAGAGMVPTFGAVNLSQAAAVSGTLPAAFGGTGVASAGANTFFAGPVGAAGVPGFRPLNGADIPLMIGANGTSPGYQGTVPSPAATDNLKFLRGDGNWSRPPVGGLDGYVQFNSSGTIAASPNLYWDNTNNRLGIGEAPMQALDVNGSLVLNNGSAAIQAYSSTAGIVNSLGLNRARGTQLVPLPVAAGDTLGALQWNAYNASTYQVSSQIVSTVDGTPGSFVPANMLFYTGTSSTPVVERLRITSAGNVGIGSNAPVGLLDVNQKLNVLPTGNVGIGTTTPLGLFDVAQKFTVLSNSNIGIGTVNPSNTLQIVGSLCVKSTAGVCAGAVAGKIYATTTAVAAADLAEHMPVLDATLVPGEVVAIEAVQGAAVFARSMRRNQPNAVGVISTSPGVALGVDSPSARAVALAGRVPVNVVLEGGAVAVGDYLVPSSTPGKAMRAESPMAAGIIGIALSAYDGTAIAAKEWDDHIAHEVGHQVMLLVHTGAGGQAAVALLKAEGLRKDAEIAQLKARTAAVEATAAALQRQATEAQQEQARWQEALCTRLPDLPHCP